MVGGFLHAGDEFRRYPCAMPRLDGSLPSSLLKISTTTTLPNGVPALLVRPDEHEGGPFPFLFWMHGRTANKELEPGRYLRLARMGIGSCAIDLPGHGNRHDPRLQSPESVLESIETASMEIDDVLDAIGHLPDFECDLNRAAIGGMSMGGMVAMARLCRPHPFQAALLEASSGSWSHQNHRQFFDEDAAAVLNPILHLRSWREIPILAIHAILDEWVSWEGQKSFLDALRLQYQSPQIIEELLFEETGAPYEHLGFGRFGHDARTGEVEFLTRHLKNLAK